MNNAWQIWWQQTDLWRMLLVFVCGVVVGCVYFLSLRWSISRPGSTRSRIKVFAGTAILRIALFFGVLMLVAHKNIILIITYLLAFFIIKMLMIGLTKKQWSKEADLHLANEAAQKNQPDGGKDVSS
jgi:FtsH-binding integral membrane protein